MRHATAFCFFVGALFYSSSLLTASSATDSDKPLPPDQIAKAARQYGEASKKLAVPANTPKPKPMRHFLEGYTVLVKGQQYTIVPAESIVYHGPRSAITAVSALPVKKAYVDPREFIKANSNDFVVLAGVPKGICKVQINNGFERNEIKIVMAVDDRGAPACRVTLE
jgi:hypothetical protein